MRKGITVGLCLPLSLAFVTVALAAEVLGMMSISIKIGQWGLQTGPVALWGSVARGFGVFFKKINGEGGINARKIE
ncbi:hypothetical protein DFAR_3230004 [Desulfarculales bacterium]